MGVVDPVHHLCPKLRILGVGWGDLGHVLPSCLVNLLPALHSQSLRPFPFIPTPMAQPREHGLGAWA